MFAAFAEAAREAAGFAAEPTATDDLLGAAGVAPEETFGLGVDDGYAGAADSWAAGQPAVLDADDEEGAALALYNLALDFQERSQASEARLLDQFEESSTRLMDKLGDLIIVDDDDERLILGATGKFRAEVLPEDSDGAWRELTPPTSWSSSTTRPTSSVTSPTRSRRPSPASPRSSPRAPRARPPRARPGRRPEPPRLPRRPVAEATTVGDDETDDTASGNGRA